MSLINRVFSIDPSINRCGWCLMSRDYTTIDFGLIKSTKLLSFQDRASEVTKKLRFISKTKTFDITLLELPAHWSSGRGFVARESGALYKLSFICGMIFSQFNNVELVFPHTWKGQLSKEIVTKRLRDKFKDKVSAAEDHNVYDAIGIAYSYFNDWRLL